MTIRRYDQSISIKRSPTGQVMVRIDCYPDDKSEEPNASACIALSQDEGNRLAVVLKDDTEYPEMLRFDKESKDFVDEMLEWMRSP